MKTFLQRPMKFGLLLSAIMLINLSGFSTTFTAVASGNWSNTLTWGGVLPSITNTLDQIIIPVGINVTMDNNVTFNGVATMITVAGTLTSTGGNILTMTTGTIAGTGTINVYSLYLGAGAVLQFSGSLEASVLSNAAQNLQTNATIQVNNSLALVTGVLNVQTGGSLTLAGNGNIVVSGGQLAVNGGSLGLNSTYNVVYNAGSTLAGLELSGNGLQNLTIGAGAANTVTLSTNVTVNGMLTLTSGILALGTKNLTLAGDLALAGAGTISSTAASNISITSSASLSGTLVFSGGANAVNNFLVDIGSTNQATVSGMLNVSGMLKLKSGVMNMNSANLLILGTIDMIGTGTISSTSNSSIGINTPVSPGGSLRFSAGNNTVDSFSVNIGSNGSVSVASDLNIFGRLTLTSGHLNIENNTLIMGAAATIVGADANSYVITGTSGSLKIPIALATLMKTEFPIGTANAYFPASVLLNPGTPGGNIQIGVTPNVYINGTSGMDISNSQPVVDATWNVQSNIVSSLNLNLELMWSPSAEVNGFVRNTSFISHYTGASWDVSAILSASAGGNGLYSLTRMNLTSLSPFTVFDQSTSTGVDELMKPSDIVLYPNPVSENIMIKNIESSNSIVEVEVVNVYGQTVANYQLSGGDVIVPVGNLLSGTYFLKMKNDKMNFVKQFIKN